MKRQLFTIAIMVASVILYAQTNRAEVLQDLEGKTAYNQEVALTATLKSASRLFGEKSDLTSVIFVIPSGSVVKITGSDSTYYHVVFEEDEGYIFKKDAILNEKTEDIQPAKKQEQVQQTMQPTEQQVSRLTYLENKYGPNMAAKLYAGKIWKGMTSQMVRDSWGTPLKINRDIGETLVREEWIYKSAWLFIENNTLVDWGPAKN